MYFHVFSIKFIWNYSFKMSPHICVLIWPFKYTKCERLMVHFRYFHSLQFYRSKLNENESRIQNIQNILASSNTSIYYIILLSFNFDHLHCMFQFWMILNHYEWFQTILKWFWMIMNCEEWMFTWRKLNENERSERFNYTICELKK